MREGERDVATRVTESGAVERIPNDAWGIERTWEILESMSRRVGEPGVERMSTFDTQLSH